MSFSKSGYVAGAVAYALFSPEAFPLEFSGYVRSGVGGSTKGGAQSCFFLPGAKSKYRLGNECEQYVEMELRQDMFRLEDGSVISLDGMAQVQSNYGHSLEFTGDHSFTRMNQIYAEWSNMPALNGGSFWAGRRFYKRNDINISDYFYWNQSATGFGFDQVAIGDLKYSYVFSRKDDVFQKPLINRHDFNVEGFRTNPGGEVELGVSYLDKPSSANSHSGWSVAAQHKQEEFLGGVNKFAVQYGRGPGTALGYTGDPTLDNSNESWRVVEFFDWQVSPRFGGQFNIVYQKDKRSDGEDQNWLSVGVRPVYALSDQFKLLTELGRDQVEAPGGTRKLTKFTIAPTWSPSGPKFWDRPEVRLYYTYAKWNKAAQRAANEFYAGSALSESGPFDGALHGSNFGVQLEYWWK
ncbi:MULTISPECIES: maltoporin [Pseudomonas putida group]|uniref:Carbohydrate porin n=1 Tax=Pseudomonas mosselii TaxID=78327 RepID=A0A5R8ZH79_9PSED|nr:MULTISPECIES: carbohydrate porin [Pseudomonas putida group]MBH3459234.1 carbohydrate porin [Pseudomonas putida]TLP65128.1 carbohydrate porin [Pseudomonas mosselii]